MVFKKLLAPVFVNVDSCKIISSAVRSRNLSITQDPARVLYCNILLCSAPDPKLSLKKFIFGILSNPALPKSELVILCQC